MSKVGGGEEKRREKKPGEGEKKRKGRDRLSTIRSALLLRNGCGGRHDWSGAAVSSRSGGQLRKASLANGKEKTDIAGKGKNESGHYSAHTIFWPGVDQLYDMSLINKV